MNKRKRLTKTKAQQRFHCFCGAGVLVVTRQLGTMCKRSRDTEATLVKKPHVSMASLWRVGGSKAKSLAINGSSIFFRYVSGFSYRSGKLSEG